MVTNFLWTHFHHEVYISWSEDYVSNDIVDTNSKSRTTTFSNQYMTLMFQDLPFKLYLKHFPEFALSLKAESKLVNCLFETKNKL